MNSIKSYLLHVASAGFLLSLILAVIPKGRVQQIAKFVGGLVLILTVITPVMKLDTDDLARSISRFHMTAQQDRTGIEISNRNILAQLIKDQCQTYISDKAEALGFEVSAEITLSEEGDYPYPVSVVLRTDASQKERDHLENIIVQDLGIPPERQEWK